MYNPSYVSSLSVRYRAPISYSFADYSFDYSFNRHLISSSQSCCCICCSTSYAYRNPSNPRYVCGSTSRQSSLIHCSYRKCYCGCVKEGGFGGERERVLGERSFKRRVSEGRSCDFETTEMMLSLLIEEVGNECYGVRERDYSSSRRLENNKTSRESEKKENLRTKYRNLRIESIENEARNRRKDDRKSEENNVFRRENCRGRKSGSSFSSYHTCLSLDEESDSDSEIHVKNEAFVEESGKGYKRDSKESGNAVYKGVVGSHKMIESDWRKKTEKKLNKGAIEDVCEASHHQSSTSQKKIDIFDDNKSKKFIHDSGLAEKYSHQSNPKSKQVSKIEDVNMKGTNISQSGYDNRVKKREDRLTGISSSVQDTEERYYLRSKEDSIQIESRRKFQQSAEISDDRVSRRDDCRLSTERSNLVSQIEDINTNRKNISQSQYEDSYYSKSEHDSRKFQQSTQISGDRVNRRADNKSNTEQSNQVSQMQDTKVRVDISQAKRREDRSLAISSSVQDTETRYNIKSEEGLRQMDSRRKFRQSAEISDDRVSQRDDFRLNAQLSEQISEIQDINVGKTKISRAQHEEGKVKRGEDRSSLISSSVQDTEYQYYLQSEGDSRQTDSRRKFKQSMEMSATQAQDNQSGRQANRKKESTKGSVKMGTLLLGQSSDTLVADIHKSSENKISSQKSFQLTEDSKINKETSYNRILRIGSINDPGGTSHKASTSQESLVSETIISHEDALEKATLEASTSKNQIEKSTFEEDRILDDHKHEKKSSNEYEEGDSKSRDTVKGPSDDVWDEVVPSIQESIDTQIQIPEKASPSGNIIVKRMGRSLWNVFSDIVRLRWSSNPKISTPKSSIRNSPNQSASEAWFSGHERDETSDENIKSGNKNQGEEYSSSVSTGENSKMGGSKMMETSATMPSLRFRRPPNVDDVAEFEQRTTVKGSEEKDVGDTKMKMLQRTNQVRKDKHDEENPKTSGSTVVETSVSMPSLLIRKSPIVDDVADFDQRTTGKGSEEKDKGDIKRKMLQRTNQVIKDKHDVAESDKRSTVSETEGKVGGDIKRRMLQRTNQVIKDRFDEWEEAFTLESEQRKVDEGFMREALVEAKKAGDMWEVPVGAVLVKHGKIIARGYNLVEELRDSTAHAEMICIREASNQLRSWRLSDTTLYITLEPCPMCAGAILQARVDTVVWGAPNKLLGADGSWIRLFPDGGEGNTSSDPTDKQPAPVHPFHPKIAVRRGVLGTECADVMQQFFQLRRRKKDKKQLPDTPSASPSCLPISNHPTKILNKMHDAFHFMFCL